MIFAIDFDGTLCVDRYPAIGEPREDVIAAVLDAQRAGDRFILWTCRIGERLEEAVAWSAAQGISLTTGKPYTPNGSELSTPFSGNRAYKAGTGKTTINSAAYSIPTIILADDNGGAYTYYKLRDMGQYLGFNVSYINGQVVVNTNEPYSDAQ